MRRFSTSNGFFYTLGVVFVFVLWVAISYGLGGEKNLLFPTPWETFRKTGEFLGDRFIWTSIGRTLLRTFEGFGISLALAIVLGVFAGQSKALQAFLKPLIIVLKSAPTAAFVFLFLVLSGSTRAPIWIVSLLAFPILYEAVTAGFASIPRELRWAAKVDQGSRILRYAKVHFPLAFPYLLLGIVSSFGLSLKTAIMAEIIAGSTSPGLGSAIRIYRNLDPSDLTPIFAIVLIAVSLVLVMDLLAFLTKKALKR